MVVLSTHRHERNRAHNFNGDRYQRQKKIKIQLSNEDSYDQFLNRGLIIVF